jgi:hypothetical protein
MKLTMGWVVVLAVTILSACGMPEQSGAPVALAAIEPTPSIDSPSSTPNIDTLVATAITLQTPRVSVPLEVVGGTFLGIGTGSFLADALAVLGVAAVPEHAGQAIGQNNTANLTPCWPSTGDHWVMYANGLTLLFEGRSADTARLTKWQYSGGPAIGFTELVAPKGVRIGGTRRDIVSAYKNVEEARAALRVTEPAQLQFELGGDSIVSFGSSDCS